MSKKAYSSIEDFEKSAAGLLERRRSTRDRPSIIVAGGTCGMARGAGNIAEAFRQQIARRKLARKVLFRETGCHGFCQAEPLVVIDPEGILYCGVGPDDVTEILDETVENKRIIDRLVFKNSHDGRSFPLEREVPFYRRQQRQILSQNRLVDPRSIEDYVAIGGYGALARALQRDPKHVIAEVKAAGLRGRGGAGFLTGKKWEFCRDATGGPKYVICNADEGDPGAYMDRSVLEGNPHSVLEGMLIGAYAMGAQEGVVYIRMEYPLAIQNVGIALEQARELGFIGRNVLGTGFDFDLSITRGAGAFVCGEETALIASVEGRRGMPRTRPPYPAHSGLWGQPTNINNVETWANVPIIIRHGADRYAEVGTQTSKGTKIFSLVGKINNTGLVEIPMGTTLREIVEDIGGGIPDGKEFKAVQTGGPSGGCIPAGHLDLHVDYEGLAEAGSMMGSGGMIVMDENTCMVDVAHYFLSFTQGESCGKCTPCRIGTRQMAQILARIKRGEGTPEDLSKLEELAETIKETSLCGLGHTAPNPVLTTLRYFRDEYEAHIYEKRCPALSCVDLIFFEITYECVGCGICIPACTTGAITGEHKRVHAIDQEKCLRCGTCFDVCPPKVAAVVKGSPAKVAVS
ncbi:MAG: NADH-quinone oxidoreductase subunit NuoF [Candidatus Krumholzibacteria bacterium]|nr:NADH-quinone oxidoreductase subunit NuoF [Candidatus Krumholzibacteria bacterium]